MPSFRAAFTLLASLVLSGLVPASPAPQLDALLARAAATLSPSAQSLVNQTVAAQRASGHKWDLLAAEALLKLVVNVETHGWPSPTCNLDNVYVRREWSTFSKKERKDYINAVLCLQTLPSKLDPKLYPGARTRYDDFVGVHISQTLSIHLTGNFLTWHRYFTWSYEQTLRKECGYKGSQPYYNWGVWADNPKASPLLDGSDTSISGDGRPYPHGNIYIPTPDAPVFVYPPQNGGGCVNSGPFVNWTVRLGPVSPVLPYIPANPQPDGLGYNPRCLVRDISSYITTRTTNDTDIYNLITQYTDIKSFQNRMQGDFAHNYFGVHAGGHYTIGGDPGGDFFASPGDPYFFFHHSSIERLFWTWQNLDLYSRTNVIADTITFNNTPPSRPATLQDPLDLSVVGTAGVLQIQNALSTLGGNGSPFCYIYA